MLVCLGQLGGREEGLLGLGAEAMVEVIHGQDGCSVPVDDAGQFWRDTVGSSTCGPVPEECFMVGFDPDAVRQVVAEEMSSCIGAVVAEVA